MLEVEQGKRIVFGDDHFRVIALHPRARKRGAAVTVLNEATGRAAIVELNQLQGARVLDDDPEEEAA